MGMNQGERKRLNLLKTSKWWNVGPNVRRNVFGTVECRLIGTSTTNSKLIFKKHEYVIIREDMKCTGLKMKGILFSRLTSLGTLS